MYGELVYRIGKQYSKERERNPHVEYPYFSGEVRDLIDFQATNVLDVIVLLELQGEYMIAYSDGEGTSHLIRLYLDKGMFEAEGTANDSNGFSMSSGSII